MSTNKSSERHESYDAPVRFLLVPRRKGQEGNKLGRLALDDRKLLEFFFEMRDHDMQQEQVDERRTHRHFRTGETRMIPACTPIGANRNEPQGDSSGSLKRELRIQRLFEPTADSRQDLKYSLQSYIERIPSEYILARTQVNLKLDDELLRQVESLVESKLYKSKTEAFTEALKLLLRSQRGKALLQRIDKIREGTEVYPSASRVLIEDHEQEDAGLG